MDKTPKRTTAAPEQFELFSPKSPAELDAYLEAEVEQQEQWAQREAEKQLDAEIARVEWDNAQPSGEIDTRFLPPPELEGIVMNAFQRFVLNKESGIGSSYKSCEQTELDGTLEDIHGDVEQLVEITSGLWDWCLSQARQLQLAHDELRELIERRTTTSLLQSRNAYLYDQAMNTTKSYEQIRRQLESIAEQRNWAVPGSAEGVRRAVIKYADDAGIERPSRR